MNRELPDLYAILGIDKNVTKQDNCDEIIRKAYLRLAVKFHPDKLPQNKFTEKSRQEIEEVYEMINNAYDLLKDSELGFSYNHISNADLGDKNPGANSYMFNFMKKF